MIKEVRNISVRVKATQELALEKDIILTQEEYDELMKGGEHAAMFLDGMFQLEDIADWSGLSNIEVETIPPTST